jgi:hypothetical protein
MDFFQEFTQSARYCKSSHSRELTVVILIPEWAGMLAAVDSGRLT